MVKANWMFGANPRYWKSMFSRDEFETIVSEQQIFERFGKSFEEGIDDDMLDSDAEGYFDLNEEISDVEVENGEISDGDFELVPEVEVDSEQYAVEEFDIEVELEPLDEEDIQVEPQSDSGNSGSN